MNHRWNNPILSWWPSPVGTTLGLPAAPAQPIDEAWPAPWPTPIAQTSWMPPTPTSPHLPQGGLFSSFDAGTTGGLFGRLAPHADNLNPARDWGVVPAPPSTGVSLMSVGGNYHSPVLHPTDWDAFPSRATTAMPPAMPEPPDRPSWDAPAGNDDKGTRANNGGSAGGQNDRLILSDVAPDNEWISNAQYAGDGHHHAPRAVYEKLPLPPETRRVFNKGTTGPLPWYNWHKNDALHRAYSDAVEELMDRFMQEHNIKPEQMTPDQARSVLKAIAGSEEPRIRVYREVIKRMWMFYRLRSGARGSE